MEYTRTIDRLTRLRNSPSGNPAYAIHFTDGTEVKTQEDAAVSYEIGNPEYRNVPVVVKATEFGRVWDVTPVNK